MSKITATRDCFIPGMAKETRSKRIEILLTPAENKLAEQMALSERATVSGLIRSRIFKKAPLIDATVSSQFIEKTAKTLFKLNRYIKDTSQPEEICNLLTQVKAELIEARNLIANDSNSQ
ncbi:MAG: hypothetical protein WBB28_24470 [Crinalium sp.]